jgi:hypothetical protein
MTDLGYLFGYCHTGLVCKQIVLVATRLFRQLLQLRFDLVRKRSEFLLLFEVPGNVFLNRLLYRPILMPVNLESIVTRAVAVFKCFGWVLRCPVRILLLILLQAVLGIVYVNKLLQGLVIEFVFFNERVQMTFMFRRVLSSFSGYLRS